MIVPYQHYRTIRFCKKTKLCRSGGVNLVHDEGRETGNTCAINLQLTCCEIYILRNCQKSLGYYNNNNLIILNGTVLHWRI